MRYSRLFGKTRKTVPHDADSVNARLLTQAGFIAKVAAGIYDFLPLGLRVLSKVEQVIREEMNAIDGQEILMPVLHPLELWETTGRSRTMTDVLYRTKGAGDKDFVLGPSHEETVTPLAKQYVQSYKDLPFALYQIQAKFRDEPRAKSGLLRGREFGMKDLYSFHATEEDLNQYYEKAKAAYLKVYRRCGLDAYIMEASGGPFSDTFSHEFSVVTPAGEDTMIFCPDCRLAYNLEIADKAKVAVNAPCIKCKKPLQQTKAIEAGNIFKLGTKYSEPFDLTFTDKDGSKKLVTMGCYGIGSTRLVGTIVEASHDEKGIIWPKSVAPYDMHLVSLGKEESVKNAAEKLYDDLQKSGAEVLFDDRDESAGVKFADSDLIGIPIRIVVSSRTLEKDSVEWKNRHEKEAEIVPMKEVVEKLKD